MHQLLQIPSWDALHPLIIHFPIALLFLAPLFILLSAVLAPLKGRPYLVAGLLILVLGTSSLYIAASTGEAAGELADRSETISAVLQAHESLASQTRIVFTCLLALLLALFVVPRFLHRSSGRLFSTYLPLAFIGIYSIGLVSLVQTAHQGARLVHEFGVHALLPTNSNSPAKELSSDSEPSTPHN